MNDLDRNDLTQEEFEKTLQELQSDVENLENQKLTPAEKEEKIEKGLMDAVKDINKELENLSSSSLTEKSRGDEFMGTNAKSTPDLGLSSEKDRPGAAVVRRMGVSKRIPFGKNTKASMEVLPNEYGIQNRARWTRSKKGNNAEGFVATNKHRTGAEGYKMFIAILPFVLLTLAFSYFPLHGWIYAFYDYKPPISLSESEFVGLRWFKMLFGNSVQVKQMAQVLINTFAMSMIGIFASILPMIFAVFLNEVKSEKFRNIVQTLTALPNFISWVMVYSIAFCLFSDSGMVNTILNNLGIITSPIKFLDSDSHTYLWMALWSIWKGLGWGAIMYLAAITTIDPEYYEAAKVEGGTRFQIMRYVTIPALMPTFMVLLMMAIANFLNNGIDQYYVFQNSFNKEHIQVLDLYVYNVGMTGSSLSLAAAISMLKSIISVVLLTIVNFVSKKTRGESII